MTIIRLLLRSLLATICCILVIILVIAGATVVFFRTADFTTMAERYGSEATGREVSIGDLQIQWSNPLRVHISDFHFGNADWGTEPDIVRLKSLDAVVDAKELLKGKVVLHQLVLSGLNIFLERDKNGVGNWRLHDFTPAKQKDPFEYDAEQREAFPSILDAIAIDSVFRMKTSSGSIIKIDSHDFRIYAQNENSPVLIAIDGAYNEKNAKMTIAGDSYAVLHDASTPYPIKIRIDRKPDTLDFEGTMTDPVNMDGAKGALTLNAPDMGKILSMFGVNDVHATFPLHLKTSLRRAGDKWEFEKLDGKVASTNFVGELVLNEGSRTTADDLVGDIHFKTIDARPIIDGISRLSRPTNKSDIKLIPLDVAKDPDITVDIALKAKEIYYDNWRVTAATLHVKNRPGQVSVEALKFSAAKGQFHMDMHLDTSGKTPHFRSKIDIDDVDIGRVLHLAQSPDTTKIINGPLNARALLDMKGKNIEQGIKNSRGGVVAYMNNGRIAKKFLELATINLRLLFGGSEGQEKMSCLLGVYTMRNGIGQILPLQLHAESASLTGEGKINLLNQQVDILMKPLEGTTEFLALDVPLHFTGPFSSIDVEPVVLGKANLPQLSARKQLPSDMMPELKSLAMRSNCVK